MQVSIITDEISQDLEWAVDVAMGSGVHNVAVRSVWGTNVLGFNEATLKAIRKTLAKYGVACTAYLSPLFKCSAPSQPDNTEDRNPYFVGVNSSFGEMQQMTSRIWDGASLLGASHVRVFPFLQGTAGASPIEDSVYWLERLHDEAIGRGVKIAVENEHTCVGGSLMEFLAVTNQFQPPLPLVIDPCNHLRVTGDDGLAVLEQSSELIQQAVDVHVKDVDAGGRYVAVGAGVVRWREIFALLRRESYEGFVTLEPHLRGDEELVRRSIEAVRSWLQ